MPTLKWQKSSNYPISILENSSQKYFSIADVTEPNKCRQYHQRNRRYKKRNGTFKLKNTVTKIKNSVNELNNRIEGIEERTSELEDRAREITQLKQQRKIDFKM